MHRLKNELAIFLLAVQFLTRLPVPGESIYSEVRFAASVRYYPLVGVLVGALCAFILFATALFLPLSIAVMLSIGSGLLITGGFHEDGLADTFDGMGGMTRERALQIMKDSRIGTYGTLALIVVIAIKGIALTTMPLELACAALVAGHGLSRLSSVVVIATSQYVRDEGTGKPVAGAISLAGRLFVLASGIAILIAWSFIWPISSMLCALAGLTIGHILMRRLFEPKLRGFTGDTLGSVQQSSETGYYLGLAAWL